MAGKNQVTLTFAGDESRLTKAMDSVGSAAKKMDTDVGKASKEVGDGFDRAGEAADGTYDKFDALESVGRGTTDTMSGLSEIMSGNVLQGATDLAGGVAALADGFAGAVLPAIKKVTQAGLANAAATARQTVATAASKTAQVAVAGATKAWTAAQWLMNAALTANPIGLVVAAIALLVAGLVIAYKKSETFRNIVNGAFGAVRKVGQSVFGWFRDNWHTIVDILAWPFSAVIKPIWKHRDSILNAIKAVPGAIKGFMKGVGDIITAPFRAAFQGVKDLWNNTLGGKGLTIPGWVPKVGGNSFTIPRFHTGGIVSGALGSETMAVLRAGERVTSGANQPAAPASGPIYLEAHIDLGNDVTKVVQVQFREQNRALKRTVMAGAR